MDVLSRGLLPDPDTTPFWGLFVVFFGIAFLRSQVTYWAARIATVQLLTHATPRSAAMVRVHGWLQGGSADRGVAAINRWGVVVVPMSFLMIGSKTIVNAAAGVTRMPFPRYLPAMLLGCAVHGTIYATVGWAAWTSALAAAAGSPWAIIILTLVVAGGVTVLILRRRRTRLPNSTPR